MANRYYFFSGTVGYAYDFDGTAQATDDRDIDDIISGVGAFNGATATDDRIALLSLFDNKIYILDRDWNRVSAEDIDLPDPTNPLTGYQAICAYPDGWAVLTRTGTIGELRLYNFAGVLQSTQSISGGGPRGLFSDDTYIYIIQDGNTVSRRTFSNSTLTTFISNLGHGSWTGGTSTSTRFLILDNIADRGVLYNHAGVLQSSEEISLPSREYESVMAFEDAAATLTLSTTDTDIREGEAVDISIASDIDIEDFVASDITVTGGTRGMLTENSAIDLIHFASQRVQRGH